MEEVSKSPASARWRRTLRGATAVGVAAIAISVAACGDDSSSGTDETAGKYPVEVVTAEFPSEQLLGETSLLRIGVRNTGDETVPALTVTISIAGKEGQSSSLPFAIRSPEPGLAQPDRPVWALAEHYPKLAGSSESAGAENASANTYDFGPLKPGATTEAIWKLSAVKTGDFTVLYEIDASLEGAAKAENANGNQPGGSFSTQISSVPPNTVVTDSGDVVTIPEEPKQPAR
ncbi:MAG: hypothetical protein WD827_01755 [Solirubrobacterales bacterium]